MGRICTNPHQSNKLLAYGFSADAADLWWSEYALVNQPTPLMVKIAEPILYSYKNSADDIPAWSLTTLLQALPGSIMWQDERYDLHISKEQDYYLIEYTGEQGVLLYRDGRDIIDICVQIITHLIVNNIPLNSSYLYNKL